jgi:hypothetical protein
LPILKGQIEALFKHMPPDDKSAGLQKDDWVKGTSTSVLFPNLMQTKRDEIALPFFVWVLFELRYSILRGLLE